MLGRGGCRTWTAIEVLRRLKRAGSQDPGPELMTAFSGQRRRPLRRTKLGAHDYLTKPFADIDEVLNRVRRVFEYQSLASEVPPSCAQSLAVTWSERMIGNSQKMQDIYKTIGMISQTDANVLIMGGDPAPARRVVADTIHHHSNYRNGPAWSR